MKKVIAAIGMLVGLSIVPCVGDSYWVNVLTLALIYAIFAMSFDLVMGYMDLPTLGQAAFSGVAAYSVALISKQVMLGFWLNCLIGVGLACVAAALFGLLALRTREAYFFMITMAMAQMLWGIAVKWRSFTGGDDGISAIARPSMGFVPWSLSEPTTYYYFVLVFFAAAFIAMNIMVRSPFGHIISGIRENELRMKALGYRTHLHKYLWFVMSGFFAGLAGVLLAYFNGFVSPADLGMGVSAEGLLMVLFGGAGTLIGPAAGALVIVFLKNIMSSLTERWTLVMGLIYVAVVVFAPFGVMGWIEKFMSRRRFRQ